MSIASYADFQQANYDENKILYGQSNQAKVLGVSNGTCNQLNPLIYTQQYKCGLGTAGGNPYYNKNKTIEKFINLNDIKSYNITSYINILIVILLIFLIYREYKKATSL